MKKGTGKLLIISALVLCLIIIVVKSYRSLSILNEDVINKSSDINVQLSRKKEQISNLISICKNYIKEDTLLNEIEELNNSFMSKDSIKDKSSVNKEISTKVNTLFEQYKEELLKNENIINSINEILSTEKRIETAKSNYNQAVNDYNNKINSFPSSIIANIRGFKEKDLFDGKTIIKMVMESE